MPAYVALVRAINVGGRNKLAMAELRNMLEGLGLSKVRSLLQSGNLVFESDRRSSSELENLLERATEKRFEVSLHYMVRTAKEWNAVIEQIPFPDEAKRDPGHLVVLALKRASTASAVRALQAAIKGPEVVRGVGNNLYITFPAGIGESKLTNALIEKTLGTRATGRNWNTALKLQAMLNV